MGFRRSLSISWRARSPFVDHDYDDYDHDYDDFDHDYDHDDFDHDYDHDYDHAYDDQLASTVA